MRLSQTRATLLLCSVALVALASPAAARSTHKHRHVAAQAVMQAPSGGMHDDRYPWLSNEPAAHAAATPRHGRHTVTARAEATPSEGFTSNELVAEARKYLGTNPTGRASLWCGAFMDLVLKRTGHAGGGNLALGYEHYGTRLSGPQVGAIAVMGRHGGGHVGVVTGIDASGNPIIRSSCRAITTTRWPRRSIRAAASPPM
jgi:uncharacterized protein (TIGR02594 family)